MSNSFKDRLKRLHDAHQRGQQTDDGPDGVYTADDAPAGGGDDEPAQPAGYGWERLGATKTTDWGPPLWIAREACDHNQDHGHWTVANFTEVAHHKLADLADDVPDEMRREDLLYMDIETTGLGEDAIAFMLGVGFWETRQDFVIEQLLLHDEDDEPALLRAFADRFKDREVLVTFNGKSFDVPVLQRRYDDHGLDAPFDDGPHLDLLPLSRRSFPGLTSYKLARLEREILAFERVDDVPGREIPRRWSRFCKNRDADLMDGVLEHNRHDVVSMEALVAAAVTDDAPQRQQSIAEETKPRSKITQKLERTYRLRGKFAQRDGTKDEAPQTDSSPSSSSATDDRREPPTTDAPPIDTTIPPDTDRAARRRTDELRSAAKSLVDQKLWREAFPLICELVALDPHDEEGREMLAKYYRREGDDHLARVVEARGFN